MCRVPSLDHGHPSFTLEQVKGLERQNDLSKAKDCRWYKKTWRATLDAIDVISWWWWWTRDNPRWTSETKEIGHSSTQLKQTTQQITSTAPHLWLQNAKYYILNTNIKYQSKDRCEEDKFAANNIRSTSVMSARWLVK